MQRVGKDGAGALIRRRRMAGERDRGRREYRERSDEAPSEDAERKRPAFSCHSHDSDPTKRLARAQRLGDDDAKPAGKRSAKGVLHRGPRPDDAG